jgi:hypothetical protein
MPRLPAVIVQPDLAEDIPSEELMISLDISPKEFGDFIQAMRLTILISQGLSITAACEQIGLSRRLVYDEHWQRLLAKAQRMVTGRLMVGVRNASNVIFDKWPAIVERQARIALHGLDKDATAAAQFLYEAFVVPSQEVSKDDSEERNYARQGHNFNPMQTLLDSLSKAQNTTINIYQTEAIPEPPIEGQVIDLGE